jgi:hypothetical protein
VDVKKYRSKPVDAVKFDGSNGPLIAEWVKSNGQSALYNGDRIYITTPDGSKIGMRGDYIVRGVLGDFYPYPEDIFKAKYEEIAE